MKTYFSEYIYIYFCSQISIIFTFILSSVYCIIYLSNFIEKPHSTSKTHYAMHGHVYLLIHTFYYLMISIYSFQLNCVIPVILCP